MGRIVARMAPLFHFNAWTRGSGQFHSLLGGFSRCICPRPLLDYGTSWIIRNHQRIVPQHHGDEVVAGICVSPDDGRATCGKLMVKGWKMSPMHVVESASQTAT
jgi:hypothetical protein